MSPTEWEEIAAEVRYLFGSSPKWARADVAYPMVTGLPARETMQVVRDLFKAGSARCPTMSEVVAAVASRPGVIGPTALRNPVECKHPAPWGFADEPRTAFCRYCYAEWDAPNVKSMGELAVMEQTRGIPT